MNALISSVSQSAYNLVSDTRHSLSGIFNLQHRGFWFRLPLTKLSLWIEWRECSVGYGWQKNDTADLEVFAGRLQGVFSIERD
ncbi:hypothetical protein [Ochrobactrum soli]|uniref:Uncharacterized protein n=1 Tax=Ochrobactrum soli TaxID=2448455 RepID=A0A849KF71_9HYPH|nr:hypothetical protein [[Ochrobactrum] soli]NNU59083.1 hypothetical protein [[Ochrobactrum] soli]